MQEQDILDLSEACEFLRLTKHTVYRKVSAQAIPYIKVPTSNKLLFSKSRLTQWLREASREPVKQSPT